MGISSAIGNIANKALGSAGDAIGSEVKSLVFGGSPTASWLEFYMNMALSFERVKVRKKTAKIARKLLTQEEASADTADSINNALDNYAFAKSLTDEYDKVVRGGQLTFNNIPVMWGNKPLMLATLLSIMQAQSVSKNGDLLRDIGPAIQAYWTPAFLSVFEVPTFPCIGAVKNLQTLVGMNVTPGVWTRIELPAMGDIQPWLLNFIASASLHLLTIPFIVTCNCAYPPPAPPAPGVLLWPGYWVNPIAIGSGKNIGEQIKNTARANLQLIVKKFTEGKNLITLGEIVVSTAIEDAILKRDVGISSVVAEVITSVAGGLVEGGKFQSDDIEKSINDSLTAVTSEIADTVLDRPPKPDIVKVDVEPPKSVVAGTPTNVGG